MKTAFDIALYCLATVGLFGILFVIALCLAMAWDCRDDDEDK